MIDFQNVSKSYGTQDVLIDASFRINPGERVGIVGANGAGKSTIFALLTDAITPDRGTVSLPNRLRIGHLRQHFDPSDLKIGLLDYAENALAEVQELQGRIAEVEHRIGRANEAQKADLDLLGDLQSRFEHIGGYELKQRAEAALTGLGFEPARFHDALATFSGGWQMRAELVRVLTGRPDVLLLDEPSNFLDVPAVEWLRDHLRDFPGTLLLISHDRYLLRALVDVTLEVAASRATRYSGNYDHYLAERVQRREQLAATRKNQDRKREKVERFIERFRAKNTKSSQVQSRVKMLEKMEDVPIPLPEVVAPKIELVQPPRTGTEVMRLDGAGFSYDGKRWLFRGLDLRIERDEKVAVVGYNGMGKTTLLRVLAGKLELGEGQRTVGHHVAVGYMSQDTLEVLDPGKTVWTIARENAADGVTESQTRSLLGAFRFPGQAIDKTVSILSGGERVRLSLARLLLDPPSFLVLDEPTTHLDVESRESLQNALRTFRGTVCMVSHDIEFLRQVAGKVVCIDERGLTVYHGGYDYYREKLTRDRLTETETPSDDGTAEQLAPAADRKARKREEAKRRQALYERRRPLEKRASRAEGEVERLEAKRDEFVARLADPTPGADFADLSRRLATIREQIARATSEWEDAMLALEELSEDADS